MLIKVRVRPGSSRSSLEKVSDLEFIAHLKSQPEKGKANTELIKLLAKHFSVTSTSVRIKTPLARTKVVEILT